MFKPIIASLLCCTVAFAGFDQHAGSGRAAGLAGAQHAFQKTAWAVAFNPAGLSFLDNVEVSFAAEPQPFGLRELSSASIVAAVPLGGGVIGAGCNRFGFELFRQITFTLAAAADISGLSAGVAANYTHLAISRYGRRGAFSFDAGVIVPCSHRLFAALHGENLTRSAIGRMDEPLRQSFVLGLLYLPVPSLALAGEYEREPLFEPTVRGGVEYSVTRFVIVRAGVSQVPPLFCGGFGLKAGTFQLDYGYQVHADLGGTHAVSLTVGGNGEGR